MSFWLHQDLQTLEEKLNWLGGIFKVKHPNSLRERFGILKEEKNSDCSTIIDEQKCECTGEVENLTILKSDCDILCLAPVLSLIIGSDKVDKLICNNFKKKLFQPYVPIKKQTKVTDYFSSNNRDEASDIEKDDTELDLDSLCNMDCMLNEFFDSRCFIRFARLSKVIKHIESNILKLVFFCLF